MKIIAIIPARKGSKGIPNKNIRLIGNQPLIAYSIQNSLKSSFIEAVYVTTDSNLIESISTTYGAGVIMRESKTISNDSATLDQVVLDACTKLNLDKGDIVVTIQPTSPNIKTSTIDSAISCFLKNKCDTVLSVVNKPRLAWIYDEETRLYKPAYKERANRQRLPPYLVETGGFVICRARTIYSLKSRFGKNVIPFIVPENESLDIDEFADLASAQALLFEKRVAFFVNGNNQIGLGHVYRSFEIADSLYEKPFFLYDPSKTNPTVFGDTTYPIFPISNYDEMVQFLISNKIDILINDVLDTNVGYMSKLKSMSGLRIVNFEDSGPGSKYADIRINALLSGEEMTGSYFGPSYFIPGKLFSGRSPIKINETVRNVFVCFGGADPHDYTNRILSIVDQDHRFDSFDFYVAIGKSVLKQDRYAKYSNKNIHIYFNVQNMPSLMSKCDVAVTSRGRTAYELAFLGIPTLSITQNENEAKHEPISEKNGFDCIGIDPPQEILVSSFLRLLTEPRSNRKIKSSLLANCGVRSGRDNVLSLLRRIHS